MLIQLDIVHICKFLFNKLHVIWNLCLWDTLIVQSMWCKLFACWFTVKEKKEVIENTMDEMMD